MTCLSLVPYQLPLPGLDARPLARMDYLALDTDRDCRDGRQWLKAIRGYLYWRAGEDWRRIGSTDRWNTARWEYLDAAKLITDIMLSRRLLSPEKSAQAEIDANAQADLDIMRGAPLPLTLNESQLTNKNRASLVSELMNDPLYTDSRLLAHLPKRKLARMVMQSRERKAAGAFTVPERWTA